MIIASDSSGVAKWECGMPVSHFFPWSKCIPSLFC